MLRVGTLTNGFVALRSLVTVIGIHLTKARKGENTKEENGGVEISPDEGTMNDQTPASAE